MKEFKKRAITPKQFEDMYGIPRGTQANMRLKKVGPRFFKPTPHRVIYFVDDIEEWLRRNPVLTIDSLEGKK